MELTPSQTLSSTDLLARLEQGKRDPTSLMKSCLELVEEITDGQAVPIDATNPFILLMDMGATLTALSIQEGVATLRRNYACLAETEEDLYGHLSDKDYLNRFASPDRVPFYIAIDLDTLYGAMVYDAEERCHKAIIPRDTAITVDGVTFTLLYPIVIRRHEHDGVQISYDTSVPNPLVQLNTVVIDYTVRNTHQAEDGLAGVTNRSIFIEVEMTQVKVVSNDTVIEKSYSFDKRFDFEDQFCFARVFFKQNEYGWKEIQTTHSEQVFDPTVATALLKVVDQTLQVHIPQIYLSRSLLGGNIRVDIYSTKGSIALNLGNYSHDQFALTMTAIDEEADVSVYTEALSGVSMAAFSPNIASGGKNALDFETLRKRVIFNATGDISIPITQVQLQSEGENNGFSIVKNIDVLTNRVFLATRKLPIPANKKLLTAANVGIVAFLTSLQELTDYEAVIDNGIRKTLMSNAVFLSTNGQLELLRTRDIDALYDLGKVAMVSAINEAEYLYTPFHYVLDSTDGSFDLRAYLLDYPVASPMNFVRQNATLQLAVNLRGAWLTKEPYGYRLTVRTKSGQNYKTLNDHEVGIQLAVPIQGETTLAYINGIYDHTTEDGERQYHFPLETNHDLDSDDRLCLTNAEVDGVTEFLAWVDLSATFSLFHYTTSVIDTFIPDETDRLLGKFLLPDGVVGNSHESLTLTFGHALKSLWRRARSYASGVQHQTYAEDVPRYYEETQYRTDPATGTIFKIEDGEIVYLVEHQKGDPMLDAEGNPVYKHRKGDPVLDEDGKLILLGSLVADKELDLLVVDARYHFADDAVTVEYRKEIAETLRDWITQDLKSLQDRLLDETYIYFYPKTTLGMVKVQTDNGGEDYLQAEQTLILDLSVPKSVFNDKEIKDNLRKKTVALLDQHIAQSVVNTTEITEKLRVLYGNTVTAFSLRNLGGSKNYTLVTLATEQNKLCLKKNLVIQADGSMIVEDAVIINFNRAA